MTEDVTAVLRRAADGRIGEYDPGDVERRGMSLRRSRQRTTALAVGALVLGLSVSSVTAVQAWRAEQPAAPGPTVSVPEPRGFIPATRVENGSVVMPVTFLDGTTAEIVYAPDLGLAEMGADPYGSGDLHDPPLRCCARDFSFRYRESFPLPTAGATVKDFPGADGGVVHFQQGPVGTVDFLVFEIGDWRLGVWDSVGDVMSDELRAMWSANLRGRVSADGFPILTATPPVRLAPLGQAHGPSLTFQHLDVNSVEFRPTGTCPPDHVEPRVDDLPDGVSTPVLCRPEWSMQVNITGDRAFVERIITTLQVRNVHLAS